MNNIINMSKFSKCNVIIFFIVLFTMYFMWSRNDFVNKPNVLKFTLDTTNTEKKLINGSIFKYILVWTLPTKDPIMNLDIGNRAFIKRNCPKTTCYVSSDRNFFGKVSHFDMIIFHGPDILIKDLPKVRSLRQKYVFASMESSHYYPICNPIFNDYFNWTWTYKLNSDEEYGYISIRDKDGVIVGPKEVMHWKKVEEMESIDERLKKKLDTKKRAAAWFVSNCETPSERENLAQKLKIELKKHNLTLDIFGACSQKKCPRFKSEECLRWLETNYYFYLSFENSFSEDYVTEKLLNALQHYTVPVVFGGANYTRFMPDGVYLNARELTISELATKMSELIQNKEKYYSYFKWHNYYSYHNVLESPQSDAYCKLCSMINDEERLKTTSIYNDFVHWWNPPNKCSRPH